MSLDSIINETKKRGIGLNIIFQENDFGKITPAAPANDPCEYAPTQATAITRANLASTNGHVHLASALETPWMGLGTVTDRLMTGQEIMRLAGLDNWNIQKIQQYLDFKDRRIETDRWGLVRSDTGEYLASVGRGYEIYQTEEGVEFLESLVDNQAVFETAGALGAGETIWFLVNFPELSSAVAGTDEIKSYCMLRLSHGNGSIRLLPTNTRTVCQNTYNQAIGEGRGLGWSFKHTKNVRQSIRRAKDAMQQSKRNCQAFNEQADHLAHHKLPNDLAFFHACLDDVLDVTIAGQRLHGSNEGQVLQAIAELTETDRRQTEEKRLSRAKRRRAAFLDDILERHESERCNGNPTIAGSAWSAVNAVTESYQHSDQFRYNGNRKMAAESRFESITQGRVAAASHAAMERAIGATA